MNASVQVKPVDLKPVPRTTRLPVDLTEEQVQAFGKEIEAVRERIMSSLGDNDARYIRRVIKTQRWLEIGAADIEHADHDGSASAPDVYRYFSMILDEMPDTSLHIAHFHETLHRHRTCQHPGRSPLTIRTPSAGSSKKRRRH